MIDIYNYIYFTEVQARIKGSGLDHSSHNYENDKEYMKIDLNKDPWFKESCSAVIYYIEDVHQTF